MISYLIKSTVCLLLLYAVYRLFLEQEKMHRFNRYFLVFSLVFGLTVPFLTFTISDPIPLSDQINEINNRLTTPPPTSSHFLSKSTPKTYTAKKNGDSSKTYLPWFIGLYSLISLVLAVRLFRNLNGLWSKIKNHPHVPWQKASLVLVDDDSPPHSFLNFIFVDKKLHQSGQISDSVLIHEHTHVRQKHSLDILLVEVLKIAFWFNPVLYFYKQAMQLNHEFLADESVVIGSNDVQGYQKMLLKMQSPGDDLQLASSIQFSITKKRMMMMTKNSPRWRNVCKQLTLIPIMAGLMFAFSTRTSRAQDVKQMSLTELMDAVNKRIENAASLTDEQMEDLQTLLSKMKKKSSPQPPAKPPAPPVPQKPIDEISTQNLLPIFITSKGLVLMDAEPVPIAKVKDRVKAFITNKGNDPELSDSPREAYIAIKASDKTSYKRYDKLLNEVKKAYLEVRREAAFMKGLNYKKLDKDSEAWRDIKKEYPEQIFLNPDKNKSLNLPPPPAPKPKNQASRMTLKKYGEAYKNMGKAYFNIPAVEKNRDDLEAAYKKVMALHHAVDSLQKVVHPEDPPPPPPIPYNPEKMIERHLKKSQVPSPNKADTSRYQRLAEDVNQQIATYLQIKPTLQNKEELERTYQNIKRLRHQRDEVKKTLGETNKNGLKPPPPPMKPTSRMMAYYRHHPELAKNNRTILEMAVQQHQQRLKTYMNIAPTEENKQALGIRYAQLVTSYKNWHPILEESGTGIELPALPEAAWKRIKAYSKSRASGGK